MMQTASTMEPISAHPEAAGEAALPRPEHPRPDFQRDTWINLNGRWRFTFDPENTGEQLRWYRIPHPLASGRPGHQAGSSDIVEDPFTMEIVVPFPWESRLSGIGATKYKGAAWYQRSIVVPAEWAEAEVPAGPRGAHGLPSVEDTATSQTAIGAGVRWRLRPYLCFGAVDWHARVWVNGRFAGEHTGGYTPFALDISRFVRPGVPATLTVRAYDACDADTPLGKQTVRWYTHSGGIWQTVWLEGRPAAYLARLQSTPHLEPDHAGVRVVVTVDGTALTTPGAYQLTLQADDGSFPAVSQSVTVPAGGQASLTLEVPVPQPHLWSPEDPHLYPCTLRLQAEEPPGAAGKGATASAAGAVDEVHTYFGLRRISTGRWEGRPYEYVLLNGQPLYLRGVLDQGFHPDGLHSYPSDAALRADLEAAKRLGCNLVRCHIKINDPRYYYWADRLGLLIMYDFPSASIYTPSARAHWEATVREALARDASHPSIIAWILFNETWGLEEHQTPASWAWVKEMFEMVKALDPTRLVEDNSACLYDHVTTDINTWHFYIGDYDRARRHIESVVQQTFEGSPFNYVGSRYVGVAEASLYKQGTQPLLNSEYAGLSARQGDRDISYSFKFLTTELRRHEKLCGYVYTELTDVEWEHNGLLNYDRTAKECGYEAFVPGMTVADLNGADVVGFDAPPCQTLPPGGTFRAPVFISHWDHRPMGEAVLHWRATMIDRFGEQRIVDEGRCAIEPRRYGVTDAGEVEVALPEEVCLLTIALVLVDERGEVRARNYVNVDVGPLSDPHTGESPLPPVEHTASGWVLRFEPDEFASSSWPDPRLGPRGSKFGAAGAGWVDYSVALPDEVDVAAIKRLRLRFEAGARTARSRIGWRDPAHVLATDYPQTEAVKLPTDLRVWVNDQLLGTTRLPDDPADARGVLSAHLSDQYEYASYGFLVTFEAEAVVLARILDRAAETRRLVVRFEVPRDGQRGGLNLYGSRMGAYPIDPTIFLDRA